MHFRLLGRNLHLPGSEPDFMGERHGDHNFLAELAPPLGALIVLLALASLTALLSWGVVSLVKGILDYYP